MKFQSVNLFNTQLSRRHSERDTAPSESVALGVISLGHAVPHYIIIPRCFTHSVCLHHCSASISNETRLGIKAHSVWNLTQDAFFDAITQML